MNTLLWFSLTLVSWQQSMAQNSFNVTYATPQDEYLDGGAVDSLGNAYLVGARLIAYSDTTDGLLMKIYNSGFYKTKIISKPDTNLGYATCTLLESGNLFVTGKSKKKGSTNFDKLVIMVMDSAMNVITEKNISVPAGYINYSAQEAILTYQGNIVLAALVGYWNGFRIKYDNYLLKINPNGDTLITHVYKTGMDIFDSQPYCWRKMPQSNDLMLIGRCFNVSNQNELEFFDEDLNLIRFNRLNDPRYLGGLQFSSEIWLDSTQFLMTQHMVDHSGPTNEYYIGVYRLDTSGHYFQELRLDHLDTIDYIAFYKSMACYDDTNVYIGGFQSYNVGPIDLPTNVYLYLLDRNMDLIGTSTLGGDTYYHANFVLATPDKGCLIMTQRYDSLPYFETDAVIWKVMPEDMTIVTSVEEIPQKVGSNLTWPNPSQNEVNISLTGFEIGEKLRFRLYDMQGNKCLDKQIQVSGNTLKVELQNLASGTYTYEIESKDGNHIQSKIIKIKY
jgi:hypothetical protein